MDPVEGQSEDGQILETPSSPTHDLPTIVGPEHAADSARGPSSAQIAERNAQAVKEQYRQTAASMLNLGVQLQQRLERKPGTAVDFEDPALVTTDPELAILQPEPAFRSLLKNLKARE
jgi:hypothetical protein